MKFSRTIPKNIPVINSYRAIGILIVCFAHYICNITGFFESPILPYLHSFGYAAVIVFFTISGFVIPWWLHNCNYKINDYGRFVARRMLRIEPPFIVALALAILYTYVRTTSPYYNGVDTIPSIKRILLHLGYLIPFVENERWIRDSYWTLAIECQWYLVMGLVYPLFFNKNQIVRFASYFVALIPCYFINNYLFQYFPVLLMGSLLCSYATNTIEKREYLIIAIAYFIFIFFRANPLTAISALVIIPLLLLFAGYNNPKLNVIGNMSYSIYLMHSLSGTALINYFSHTVHHPFMKIIVVIAGVVFTLITSYIFYRLVEKPAHKISLKVAVNEYEFKQKQK
ncbi:MAG: acyltransferase [Bacteroidetes bacterium]|nr:acyltransferase [Bacteroidota bacterium]